MFEIVDRPNLHSRVAVSVIYSCIFAVTVAESEMRSLRANLHRRPHSGVRT